jgi:hypothetical protein
VSVPEPVLAFRPPVVIEPRVVQDLCHHARRGYEASYKRETFGFLYGTLKRDRRLVVREAVHYRGGNKSRTGVWFGDWPSVLRVLNRREQLARDLGMRFLGGFHSHVEIAGTVFRGLSESDHRSFRRDFLAALEAVVFVWAGGRPVLRPPGNSIAVYERDTDYSYRIRLYAKRRAGIRLTAVRVPKLGNTLEI